MPVYHKHKLIHIHIPKTAGTAIESFFHRIGDMQWGPESWLGQEQNGDRWYEYQHLSMMELRTLAGSLFPGFKSFAVVRDPYTRLLSDFAWRQRVETRHPDSATQFFDSFDAFLQAIPEDINTHWSDYMRGANQKWANFLIHVRPQYQFILDHHEHLLVEKTIKYESLAQDLTLFLDRYGLHADNIRSPQLRDTERCMNRKQIRRVNDIYARDFELFSYLKKTDQDK